MANTVIQIKRSTTTAAPTTLAIGELAYSYSSNTLYLGNTTGTGVLAIGGLSVATSANNYAGFMANSANAFAGVMANSANAFAAANVVTANTAAYANILASVTAANNYAGFMANSGNAWTLANIATANTAAYANILASTTAANNYAGFMANSGNAWTLANIATANTAAYSNILASTTAANNYAGFMANSANAFTVANTAALNSYVSSTFVKLSTPGSSQLITGDINISGNLTINGTQTFANTQTLLIGDNLITLNADIPSSIAPTENAGLEVNRGNRNSNAALTFIETAAAWAFTSNTLNAYTTYIASNTLVETSTSSANNYAGVMANSANAFAAANVSTANTAIYGNILASSTAANNYAGFMANSSNARADTKVASVSGTTGRITSSGGTTPAIDLATAGAGAASYSSGISAITVDAYGRVTSVTGSGGFGSGTVTSVANGAGLTGGTITTSGTLAVQANSGIVANINGVFLATAGAGATSPTGGISAITVDAFGRVTSVTGSAGYVTSSGVTSVATGTGLTGGTITTTGTLSVDFTTVATATNTTAAFAAANTAGAYANNYSNASNLSSGTVPTARISGSYTGITGVGTLTAGVWNGTTISVPYGGTGLVSATANGILFGNGTNALQVTAAGTDGQVLQSDQGLPKFAMLDGGVF